MGRPEQTTINFYLKSACSDEAVEEPRSSNIPFIRYSDRHCDKIRCFTTTEIDQEAF